MPKSLDARPLVHAALALTMAAFVPVASSAQDAPTATDYQSQIQTVNQGSSEDRSGSQQPQAPEASGQTPSQAGPNAMPPSPPADAVSAVRLSDVEGSVRLFDAHGKVFDQARLNMAVLPGMRVETGGTGRAELQFPDGSVARVTPNSALELSAGGSSVIKAVRGLTYFELAQGSTYSIVAGPLTAQAAQAAGQATLLRVNLDTTPYELAVLRGSAQLQDTSGSVTFQLDANQTAKIDPEAATNYDVVQAVNPESWDAWNTDRDQALSELASSPREGSDVEGSGAGWSDLDYYGSWYDVPGEGMAWAPDGVGANFDPYGSGSWGYYTNVGYTWASSYPWGWLPYHCGSWNHQPSYGWMWLPGGCGSGFGGTYGGGWYPYAPVHGAPGGYRLPPHPVPARGFVHVPPSQALISVDRSPQTTFRRFGEPRPAPRVAVVAGETITPVPVAPRPPYRGAGASGFVGGSRTTDRADGLGPLPAGPGYTSIYTPGSRAISPSGGVRPPASGTVQPGSRVDRTEVVPRFTPSYRPATPVAPIAQPRPSMPAAPGPHYAAPAPAAPASSAHPH